MPLKAVLSASVRAMCGLILHSPNISTSVLFTVLHQLRPLKSIRRQIEFAQKSAAHHHHYYYIHQPQ